MRAKLDASVEALSQHGCPQQGDSFPADPKQFCQFYVEHLNEILSAIAVWVSYFNPASHCHQDYYSCRSPYAFKPSVLAGFVQKDWWYSDLSMPAVHELPALLLAERFPAYLYPLGDCASEIGYVVIWKDQNLSEPQRQEFTQQAWFLNQYLSCYQKTIQQQSAILCLEQTIHQVEHQLRSPLALLDLCSELLCLELPGGTSQDKASLIHETVRELSENLKSLTCYGKRANLQLAICDVRDILIESVKGLHPWLSQKEIQVSYSVEPLLLKVDRWQLKQVINNLLNNAIHFSPVQGTITCSWQIFSSEVLIEIRDQGAGLSQADMQQAFAPFYSNRAGGTGMGLAIAKKIVLDHGGRLWADNLPEGGAQFSIVLPR